MWIVPLTPLKKNFCLTPFINYNQCTPPNVQTYFFEKKIVKKKKKKTYKMRTVPLAPVRKHTSTHIR